MTFCEFLTLLMVKLRDQTGDHGETCLRENCMFTHRHTIPAKMITDVNRLIIQKPFRKKNFKEQLFSCYRFAPLSFSLSFFSTLSLSLLMSLFLSSCLSLSLFMSVSLSLFSISTCSHFNLFLCSSLFTLSFPLLFHNSFLFPLSLFLCTQKSD